MHTNKHDGFTLVELIVVIAIIAILAAVSITGFSSFIDNARLSNDEQAAAAMNRALDAYAISNDTNNLEAHEVRSIIADISGEEFDWTPQSSQAGFFYIAELNKIIVAKYNDVENLNVTELEGSITSLLNTKKIETTPGVPGDLPEELFGSGMHLVTFEGSPIAEVVHIIRNYADMPFTWDAIYERLEPGLFERLFGGTNQLTLLQDTMETFHPSSTLYVNNAQWKTEASVATGFQIERIVFTPNISNIPNYTSNELEFLFDTISLPKSVVTIQANAFSSFQNLTAVNYLGSGTLNVEAGAFASVSYQGPPTATFSASSLVDYSDIVAISPDGTTYNFTNLPIREQVVAYNFVRRSNGVVELFIYTDEGLVGYASNMFTINYYYNFLDGSFPDKVYYTSRLLTDRFVTPLVNPGVYGYSFEGWYADEAGTTPISAGTLLSSHNVDVYGLWEHATYTLTFNVNGGDTLPPEDQTLDAVYLSSLDGLLPTPTRTGYTFLGWGYSSTSTEPVDLSIMIGQDDTMYAIWESN